MSKVSDVSLTPPASRSSYGGPSAWSPSNAAVSTSTPHCRTVVYELVPLRELATLDPTKTVKSLLFNAKHMSILNRISYKGRVWFSAMFIIGNLLTFAIVIMPARIGQWFSVLAISLQLSGVFFTTLAIRYEMLRLLVRTYDFWFFTVANLMFGASFAILLGDLRILALFIGVYLIELGIIADAQLGNLKALVISSICNIICHVMLLAAVLFRFVDESKQVVMFRYSHDRHAITTRDMLLNSMVNMIVLFTRLWYRKRAALKERIISTGHRNLFSVNTKCVSYRCHVRLSEKHSSSFMTRIENIVPTPAPSQAYGSGSGSFTLAVQLQYSKVPRAFAADDTILARLFRGRIPSCWWQVGSDSGDAAAIKRRQRRCTLLHTMLYVCGITGWASHSAVWVTSWFNVPCYHYLLQALSISGTAVFCGTFIALHQVQLVAQLFKSFDFVFLTAKILMGLFCALRFLEWEHKFLTLGTSFVWMYWLLSLDALTPQVRAWLGFRIQYAGIIAAAVIVTQTMFVLDLFWLDLMTASDRILFRGEILGKPIEIHAMSVFLNQLWSILAWFCRILWRIMYISGEDEMLMLLGQVGYDNYMYERKRRRRRAHILQHKLAVKHSRLTMLSKGVSIQPAQ